MVNVYEITDRYSDGRILKKVNSIFGSDLKDDDKVTIKRVEDELFSNSELTKVLMGDNSEDVKFDYFKRKVMIMTFLKFVYLMIKYLYLFQLRKVDFNIKLIFHLILKHLNMLRCN